MIHSIDITSVKYTAGDQVQKYVLRKIGKLDRYLPRHARKSVTADVKLKQVNRDHGNKYEAEIIINVPDKRLTAKDSTVNMFAAIDIVEAKIINQLRKYKQETIAHVGNRRVLSRSKRSQLPEQSVNSL
ncbi:MAG: ribosome-associated translation inhibitor RaiA [Candidatus Microsaccharimonas sossegonensis]|uniref:Ribosome-associated translation inhibitor RaiA n=1 Tax=Candidatus Microsaccharimonas sossegonensis TaxID=2506948 RepID=A0A4Q0AHT5_9BACT|nr:MAG: ribosome-associated translation inhibitor RaiA [Candidatus Microsaccharimonas sossegonensis]